MFNLHRFCMFLRTTVILSHSSNLVNFDVEVYLLEHFTKGKSIILKVLPSVALKFDLKFDLNEEV